MAYRNIDSVSKKIRQKKEKTISNSFSNLKPSRGIKRFSLKPHFKKQHLQKLSSAYLMMLMIFQSLAGVFMYVPKEVKAYTIPSEPYETLFYDNADTDYNNWITYESPTISTAIKNTGAGSFDLSNGGAITKLFSPLDLNSPVRELSFWWYPKSLNSGEYITVLDVGEGTESACMTNDLIKMKWNGSSAYFEVKSYNEAAVIASNTSDTISISNEAHLIKITTSTDLTKIEIDGIPVAFSGNDSSSILTNTWNVLKFGDRNWIYQTRNNYASSQATPSNDVKDDDGIPEDFYSAGTKTKHLNISSSILDNISSAYIKFYADRESSGSFSVGINGHNYSVPVEDGMIGGYHWIVYKINKADLVPGDNVITFSGILKLDTTNNYGRSLYNGNPINGEWLIRVAYAPYNEMYVDDIIIKQIPILTQQDIDEKVSNIFNFLHNTAPDSVSSIYAYQLTGDPIYLSQAEADADNIQSSLLTGDNSVADIRELAILSQYNPNRLALLRSVADTYWQYHVNHSTNLIYAKIAADGAVTDNQSPLVSNIRASVAYLMAYKVTGDSIYLNHAKAILDAYYSFHNSIGLPYWVLNSDGSIVLSYLKVGDGAANYIQTALLFYDTIGDSKYLDMAKTIADAYIAYGWSGNEAFYYTLTNTTPQKLYELYTPMMDTALLKLYEHTNISSYKTIAITDYEYMAEKNKRNSTRTHAFDIFGRPYHQEGFFIGSDALAATLMQKHTGDSIYMDNMYKYELQQLKATDWRGSTLNGSTYQAENNTNFNYAGYLLYSLVRPDSNVTVNSAFGGDLYENYTVSANIYNNLRFDQDNRNIFIRDVKSSASSGNLEVDDYFNNQVIVGSNSFFTLGLTSAVGNYNIPFGDWPLYKVTSEGYKEVLYLNSVNTIDSNNRLSYTGMPYDVVPLTVSPSSDSVDVTINTWHTSSDYYKKWTEDSTSHNITTLHTVGDLVPHASYILKIDGQETNTYDADNNGQITFTYQGGYSTHTFEIEQKPSNAFIPPTKPSVSNTNVTSDATGSITLNNLPSNITHIAISTNKDFDNTSWEDIAKKEELLKQYANQKEIYIKLRTNDGAVSDTITYTPSQTKSTTLQDGDTVKTPSSPDIYVIKLANNKKYKRLILSPSVFTSYQHLKWENIKTITEEELNQYQTSNLVKELTDTIVYTLIPDGDTGKRKPFDITQTYDPDSIYTINKVDRDSYEWEE